MCSSDNFGNQLLVLRLLRTNCPVIVNIIYGVYDIYEYGGIGRGFTYLIFVTGTTGGTRGEKSVMWTNS